MIESADDIVTPIDSGAGTTIAPTATSGRHARGYARVALRVALSVLMLAVLVWRTPDFDPDALLPHVTATTWAWLGASAVTLALAFVLQTLRWQMVLKPMGHTVPFGSLLAMFGAGQFVSNVLPTAFGGDVVRIARLGRRLDDRAGAFASIALERLTGWLVLPLISLVTVAATPEFHHLGGALTTALVVNAITLTALVVLLVIASHPRWTHNARTATGWRRWVASTHLGLDAIRRHPRTAGSIVAAGVAFQVTQCLSVWMAAQALELPMVGIVASLAFFPPTAISQNLPVGFGGLGIREGGFVLFFGALGAPRERAIALGLMTYLVTVAVSSLGAPSFALRRREMRRDELARGAPRT